MIKKLLLLASLTFGVFAVENIDVDVAADKLKSLALTFKNDACYDNGYIKKAVEKGTSKEQILDEMRKDVLNIFHEMNNSINGIYKLQEMHGVYQELYDALNEKSYLSDETSYYSITKATAGFSSEMTFFEMATAMYKYSGVKISAFWGDSVKEELNSKCEEVASEAIKHNDLKHAYHIIMREQRGFCLIKSHEASFSYQKKIRDMHMSIIHKFSWQSNSMLNAFIKDLASAFSDINHKFH